MKNYFWDLDTLGHFNFILNRNTLPYTLNEITLFVLSDCTLEEGDCDEMLILDLTSKVLKNSIVDVYDNFARWVIDGNVEIVEGIEVIDNKKYTTHYYTTQDSNWGSRLKTIKDLFDYYVGEFV
jgi:hypothetical protein